MLHEAVIFTVAVTCFKAGGQTTPIILADL